MIHLHVAMFSDSYLPYVSGAVRSLERLAAGLRDRGHTVTIFVPTYRGYSDSENAATIERCSSIPIYAPAHLVLALPRPGWALARLRELGVDIVHTHSPATLGRTAVSVGRKLDVPVVFTHHSVYHEYACYAPAFLQPLARRAIVRWISGFCRSVDQVIAPSHNTQEYIRRTYGLESAVVSNPIPAAGAAEAAVATAAAPSDGAHMAAPTKDMRRPVLIYAGRLAPEKNLSLLIEAFAAIRAQREAQLVLVGDGPERARLTALAQKFHVESDMTITGFLPYDELLAWYAKAALFLFPSSKETQGMVILEAMAQGVPAVAVNSPVNAEVLQLSGAGWLAPTQPAAMAEAVVRALADPERLKQVAAQGRQYAGKFTTANVAAQVEAVYNRLIVNRSIR